MKIYTKTGDKGMTSLIGGKIVLKSHDRVEAYGSVDELISYVGLLRDKVIDKEIKKILLWIQERLMTISAHLAAAAGENNDNLPVFHSVDIEKIEHEIDTMDETLPILNSFIIPGGHEIVSFCHIARNICRRAERNVVKLTVSEFVDDLILTYLNRLSDYLFVLARKIGVDLGIAEIPWNNFKIK